MEPKEFSPKARQTRRKDSVEETRHRILESARDLFNSQGVAAISTNHIAAAAGLSVGNLYYHYRQKQEIIRALFALNEAENLTAFAPPTDRPLAVSDLEMMLLANFRILWRYRFFYRELVALLNADAELATNFRNLRNRGFQNFSYLLQAFAATGVLRPIADAAEVDRLAQSVWLISEFYLPYVESGVGPIEDENGFAWQTQGLALLRHALQPYLP